MAILSPTTGTPGSNQWGPTTKTLFNKFTTSTAMSSVHADVIDVIIENAVERPTAIASYPFSGTANIVLVDEQGKAIKAVAGQHYMSPDSNTTIASAVQINLTTNAYYIKGNGDVSFANASVSETASVKILKASQDIQAPLITGTANGSNKDLTISAGTISATGNLTTTNTITAPNIYGTTFSGTTFSGTTFSGTTFSGGAFSGTTVTGTTGTFSEQISIIDSSTEPASTTIVTPITITTSTLNANTVNGNNGNFDNQITIFDSTNSTTISPTLVSTTTISGTTFKGTTFSGTTFSGGAFSGTTINGTTGTFTNQVTIINTKTNASTIITPTTVTASTISATVGNFPTAIVGTISGSGTNGVVIVNSTANVANAVNIGSGTSLITLKNGEVSASAGNFKNITVTDGITLPTTTNVQILNASTRVSTPLVSATTVSTTNLTATSTIIAGSVSATTGNFDTFYLNGRAFTSTTLTTLCVSTTAPSNDGTYSLWVNSTGGSQVLNYLSVSTNTAANSWVPLGAVFK